MSGHAVVAPDGRGSARPSLQAPDSKRTRSPWKGLCGNGGYGHAERLPVAGRCLIQSPAWVLLRNLSHDPCIGKPQHKIAAKGHGRSEKSFESFFLSQVGESGHR